MVGGGVIDVAVTEAEVDAVVADDVDATRSGFSFIILFFFFDFE